MTARPSLSELVAIRDRMVAARAAAGLVSVEFASLDPTAQLAVETFIRHAGADMSALVDEAAAVLAENVQLKERCRELALQLGDARTSAKYFQASLMRHAVETAHAKRPTC